MCTSHLRTCGINGKQQALIHDTAKEAHRQEAVIDWDEVEGVGGYRFPAAWMGDVPMGAFIEMLMHVLFPGNAESNFKLANKCMSSVGRPVETFKKTVHDLLRDLTTFNLSWLLCPSLFRIQKRQIDDRDVGERKLAGLCKDHESGVCVLSAERHRG